MTSFSSFEAASITFFCEGTKRGIDEGMKGERERERERKKEKEKREKKKKRKETKKIKQIKYFE